MIQDEKFQNCPKCKNSWDDGSIVETFLKGRNNGTIEAVKGMTEYDIQKMVKENYYPPYRWTKKIGIKINDNYTFFKCPHCETFFDLEHVEVNAPASNYGIIRVTYKNLDGMILVDKNPKFKDGDWWYNNKNHLIGQIKNWTKLTPSMIENEHHYKILGQSDTLDLFNVPVLIRK